MTTELIERMRRLDRTFVEGNVVITRTDVDTVEEALAHLERYAWRDVEEELPESWSGFASRLVIVHGGVAYYDHRKEQWFTVTAEDYPGQSIDWEVTHWMPLPLPPEVTDAART